VAGAKSPVREEKLRLKGKVAVITGGTSGIGLATAILFAKEGAKVVIASRDNEAGKFALEQIKSNNGEAIFVKTDVSNEEEVKVLIAESLRRYKKIDILFNNAGIELQKPVTETSNEELAKVIDINLKGVFYGCKYAIPYMIRNGGGSIINTASVAGLVGFSNLAAYSASKGAVVALTKQIAIDYAKKNIRVNCICPGVIATPMVERFIAKSPNPEETRRQLNEIHPIGRIGKAEEVANAVLFLASDESSFITGHSLVIDGGLSAQ